MRASESVKEKHRERERHEDVKRETERESESERNSAAGKVFHQFDHLPSSQSCYY